MIIKKLEANMSKGVIFNIGTAGHFNPTLAVVKELVRQGDQITYFVSSEHQVAVEATGATFRPTDPPARCGGRPRNVLDMLRLTPIVDRLLPQVRAESADYVLYDSMCVWGRVLAEILQIPRVRFCATHAFSQSTFTPFDVILGGGLITHGMFDRGLIPPGRFSKDAIAAGLFAVVQSKLNQVSAQYGIAHFTPQELFTRPEMLNIVFVPKAFQLASATFDDTFKFVGPSMERQEDGISDFPFASLLELGRPIMYISLGTMANNNAAFYRQCFAAFRNIAEVQVVMAIGKHVDVSRLGPIPANFTVRPTVPQLKLLEHVSMFITHGGMNSTMEALYYGIPLIVVPHMGEQTLTAKQVVDLGLGITLVNGTRSKAVELEQAVLAIQQNVGYSRQAHALQRQVRDAGGYQRAALEILRFKENQFASGVL
ncbi:MAG: glycosyltransferase [Herpetosiphon sp.]